MRRIIFLFTVLCAHTILAATITSNAVTGNWTSPASWVGGIVPGPADDAVIVSGAVITLNVNASITALQINTGGTFNCSTNTLTLTGNFFNNGTFNSGTGTVHFNGFSLPQSIFGTSITTFNNIINDNTNGATGMGVTAHEVETRIKGNFVQNGVFNRNSTSFPAATIRFTGNTFVTGTTSLIMNHVIIDAGATLHAATGTFPQSSSTYVSGNFTNNGTLDPGTGTFYFQFANGSGNNQSVNAGASPFYNLTVNKTSGTVTVLNNITVLNDFTIAAGTWSAGTFTLNVGGDFSNSGTFTAGTGLVLLNGNINQNLNAGTSSFYNFTVNKAAGDVYLQSNVTAANNVNLASRNIYTTNSFEVYASNNNPATSLTGGTSSSFIIGRLRRAVTATANNYSFPIGPMNVSPVKFRPVVLLQSASGGASNVSMIGDTIGNSGIRKANWYVRIGANSGTPTGSLQFSYNLSNDFPAGMQECILNVLRGSQPPPANWNFVLTTTVAPSGAANGSITAAIPATLAPNSFIIGEPTPAASSTTICSGNTATLNVISPTGNVEYDWYSAAAGGTLLQNNNASYTTPVLNTSATYYVEYFNALTSCSSPRTAVTVNVNPTPVASFSTGDSICTGSNHLVTFNGTAGGGASYTWNFNGGTVASGTGAGPYQVNWNTTGTKNITLSISENSCISNTATLPVIVGNPPSATFSVSPVSCQGDTLTVSYTGISSPNAGYSWAFGTAAVLSGTGAGPYTISYSSPGNKSISLTVDDYNCSAVASQNIAVNPTPTLATVTASSSTICQGDQTTLTASGSTGGTVQYNFYDQSNGGSLLGSSPLNVSPGSTTTYYLEVINTDGCRSSANRTPITVTVNPTPTPATVSTSNDTICQGDATTLTASGSSGGTISYNFYDQAAGGSLLGSSPLNVSPVNTTTYYLEVINSDGCLSSATRTPVQVTVNPTPTAATVTLTNDTICQGDAATITASGSNGGTISYNFYDQSSGGSLVGSSPLTVNPATTSTYYLEVVNTAGCLSSSARTPVTVTLNPTPTPATITVSSDTICMGDAAVITASGSTGGTVAYNFYDQPSGGTLLGNSPLTVSPTSSTTYYLEVINSDNCLSSTTRTPVTITVNPTPSGTTLSASNDTICQGDATTLTATGATGGSVFYNFYDQSSGGTLLGASPLTVTPSVTTTYYLETNNSNGCTSSAGRMPITVTVNPTPTPAAVTVTNDTICQGESTTISATGSTGGAVQYDFYDQLTGGNLIGNSPLTVSPTASTTYYLEVINANGCKSSPTREPVEITVNPTPTAAMVSLSNDTICSGDSTIISASGSVGGSVSYNLFDQLTGGNMLGTLPLVVAPASSTTYYLEVINNYGCKSSSSREPVVVTVNPTPAPATISVSNDTICQGTSATITASGSTGGSVSYNFYDQPSGGTVVGSSPLTVNPANSTSYYLEVINNFGCKSDTSRTKLDITVNPTPTAATVTTSADTICEGASVTISASGSTGGVVSYTFYDQSNGGSAIGSAPLNVSPTATTTYFLEVSNEFNCLASATRQPVTVVVNPTPTPATISMSDDTICSGETTVITASGSSGGTINYNFYDQVTGGTLLGNSPLTVSPVTTTTYYLEVVNTEGCSVSTGRQPVSVTVNTTPLPAVVSASNDTICQGEQTIITASGSSAGVTYSFYDASVGGTFLGTSPLPVSPSATTTYYLEVVSAEGCKSSSLRTPVTITVNNSAATPIVENARICSGESATLTASSNNATIRWYEDAAATTLLASGNTYITPELQSAVTYYAVAYTNEGCPNSTGATPATVTVDPVPEVSLTADPSASAVTGQLVTITANPSGYTFYDFLVNNVSMQSGASNVFESYTFTNGDLVTIKVTDGNCSSIVNDSLKLEIKPLPNAFTPNGDGKNDRFIKGLDVTILNRWGQQLYQGTDGWDGTYNGKAVTPGTYYYTIRLKGQGGEEKIIQGPLTLIAE